MGSHHFAACNFATQALPTCLVVNRCCFMNNKAQWLEENKSLSSDPTGQMRSMLYIVPVGTSCLQDKTKGSKETHCISLSKQHVEFFKEWMKYKTDIKSKTRRSRLEWKKKRISFHSSLPKLRIFLLLKKDIFFIYISVKEVSSCYHLRYNDSKQSFPHHPVSFLSLELKTFHVSKKLERANPSFLCEQDRNFLINTTDSIQNSEINIYS